MPLSAPFSAQYPHFPLFFPFLLFSFGPVKSLILSGGTDSFARYPKWAQTFENELSLEFKTRMPNALLLYTDDAALQHNFFSIFLLEGRIQFEFRLGEQQMDPLERRLLVQIGLPETRVDDGRWHRLTFFQAWENVKVQLDEEIVFRVLDQRSFSLGNIRTNSDIFIGGIPKEVEKLSSPLRRHSRRFAGSIRNLFYRIYPQGMANPLLMDSLGTRKTDEDYCQMGAKQGGGELGQSYCQNEGQCFSANNGPRCDCSFSDFEGRRCEIKKPSTEISFFGNEWLGYDLRGIPSSDSTMEEPNKTTTAPQNGGGDDLLAVWSRREVYNVTFRTNLSSSIILIAGDSRNHVKLLLEKGVILAQSQLADTEMRIIRVQDRARRRVHLDDGLWHSVCLIRELNSPGLKNAVFSMRLIVDDFFDQDVRQFAHHPWMGNSFLFLGGAPHSLAHHIPDHLFPFRGCIKKAFFQSGPIQLNMIQLADQGFGQSNVQTFGDLSYSCSPNAQIPEVFSFNSGLNFTKLPAWRSPARGTLAFQFRTLLSEGLILYHGMANCKNFTICDYLAFEMVDGHLMMVINLGSGDIRLQASAKTLNDGHWHSVVMERSGRRGFVTADSLRTDFACPGISANLNIEEPIYLGGVPWPNPFIPRHQEEIEAVTVIELVQKEEQEAIANVNFPSAVWTIGLRQGFIGCLKNIRVNGINAEIAAAFLTKLNQTAAEKNRNIPAAKGALVPPISAGCPFSFAADFCAKSANGGKYPCKNDGQCISMHNSFRCDCSNSLFDGPICQQKPRLVQFPLPFPFMARFVLSGQWQIESENLEFKFRPRLGQQGANQNQKGLFILLDTKGAGGAERLMVALVAGGGLLADWVFSSGEERIFQWANGSRATEEEWHSAKIRRRGRSLGLFFDGEWTNYTLQAQNPSISIGELAIGQPIGVHRIREKPEHLFRFHGDFRQFSVNGIDLLRSMRGGGGGGKRQQTNFPAPSKEEHRFHWKATSKKWKMDEHRFGAKNEFFATAPPLAPSLSPAAHFANDSFFTKAPLGCLGQSAAFLPPNSCEPEPSPEDSFFTPIVSKPFHRPPSTTNLPPSSPIAPKSTIPPPFPSTTKSTAKPSPTTISFSSSISPTLAAQKEKGTATKGAASPSKVDSSSSSSSSSHSSHSSSSSSFASFHRSTKMPGSREQLELLAAQRQRFKQNSGDKSKAGGYYEPVGGWPMRTRTWPDGRRLGQDGVRKWQKLRPKLGEGMGQRQREEKTTTRSSSSTERESKMETTKITSKSTTTKTTKMTTMKTTTTTTMKPKPTERITVDPNVKPGVHFTFAPTASSTTVLPQQRKLTAAPSSTLAPRFPIGPDDPTLYAVRPTTPMNGATLNTPPTSIGPPTSTNQLGDDKKILIGVGSLSIVVMIVAILLCVFCKRCNHFCSQMAAAAGAGSAANQVPPGFKAGYTPIPPNEFAASPQMQQHHQMANFENNGTTAARGAGTTATVTTSLLRNGGGGGGGQIGNGVGATERQTRVILANGNGGLRETTSLVNAGTGGGGQQQQRKREFKEWYV